MAELKTRETKASAPTRSCLYIKRLSDVHVPTLKKLVAASVRHMKKPRTS